jgi:hypothetical protein
MFYVGLRADGRLRGPALGSAAGRGAGRRRRAGGPGGAEWGVLLEGGDVTCVMYYDVIMYYYVVTRGTGRSNT